MNDKQLDTLRAWWRSMHEQELAGHFTFQLLDEVDKILHPIRCTQCGGHNIQCAMMVNPNTREVGEDFGSWKETDTKWCEDCEKHVQLVQAPEQEMANART